MTRTDISPVRSRACWHAQSLLEALEPLPGLVDVEAEEGLLVEEEELLDLVMFLKEVDQSAFHGREDSERGGTRIPALRYCG